MTGGDFSDVVARGAAVEMEDAAEFEFDGGAWRLRHGRGGWEIQFESEMGEEAIVVERGGFDGGRMPFDIDGEPHELALEDFERVDAFARRRGLV